MTVEELFKRQAEFQSMLGCNIESLMTKSAHVDYIKSMQFHLNQEVSELIEEIGGTAAFKPWSKNYHALKTELFSPTDFSRQEGADVLMFAINIALASGLTHEHASRIIEKTFDKNITRQQNGY